MEKAKAIIIIFQRALSLISMLMITVIIARNFDANALSDYSKITIYGALIVEILTLSCGLYLFNRCINSIIDSKIIYRHILDIFFLTFIFIFIGLLFSVKYLITCSILALSIGLNIYTLWIARAFSGLQSFYLTIGSILFPLVSISVIFTILLINKNYYNINSYILITSIINVIISISLIYCCINLKTLHVKYFINRKEEFSFRLLASLSSAATAIILVIPVYIYDNYSFIHSSYVIFALRLKASFLFFIYILELGESYLFKKFNNVNFISLFYKKYKLIGFYYFICMFFSGLVFYNYGEFAITKIYGNQSHELFIYICLYLFSFSFFGIINNGATLLIYLGNPRLVAKVIYLALIPYSILLYFSTAYFDKYFIFIDIICFIIIFTIISIIAHFELSFYIKKLLRNLH